MISASVSLGARRGYLGRLIELARAIRVRPGEVAVFEVSHDAWCEMLHGGRCCDCNPDITLHRPGQAS